MKCEWCDLAANRVCGHIGALTGTKRIHAFCRDHAVHFKKTLNPENLATYRERGMPQGVSAGRIAANAKFEADFADRAMFEPEHDMSTADQGDFWE